MYAVSVFSLIILFYEFDWVIGGFVFSVIYCKRLGLFRLGVSIHDDSIWNNGV